MWKVNYSGDIKFGKMDKIQQFILVSLIGQWNKENHTHLTFYEDGGMDVGIFEESFCSLTDEEPMLFFLSALCKALPVKSVYIEYQGQEEWFDCGVIELKNGKLYVTERVPGKPKRVTM